MDHSPSAAYAIANTGALLIFLELARPGRYLPGIAGAALLTWGCYTLSHCPINTGALLTVVAGLFALSCEVLWNTRLLGALVGALCLGLGAKWLLQTPHALSPAVVWICTVVFAVSSTLLAHSAREARRNKRRDLAN